MEELDRVEIGKLPPGVSEDRFTSQGYERKRGWYHANGSYKSKRYCLGRFNTPKEAGNAYQEFNQDPEKWLRKRGKI